MDERPTLYHGGVRGLHRRSLVLPPSVTRVPSCSAYGAAAVHRTDRVYATADVDVARMFALLCAPSGKGDVYVVEPMGTLEPDPDYHGPAETPSYQAHRFRVVDVVERRVARWRGMTAAQALRVLMAA